MQRLIYASDNGLSVALARANQLLRVIHSSENRALVERTSLIVANENSPLPYGAKVPLPRNSRLSRTIEKLHFRLVSHFKYHSTNDKKLAGKKGYLTHDNFHRARYRRIHRVGCYVSFLDRCLRRKKRHSRPCATAQPRIENPREYLDSW